MAIGCVFQNREARVASHRGRRISLIELLFAGLFCGAISCGSNGGARGERGSSPPLAAETNVSRLTTARTAAGEQARVAAWTNRAAIYGRLSAENKQARPATADLADRLAATAQRTADFHTQRAADMAAASAGGTVGK
jgi:hypothetical protein